MLNFKRCLKLKKWLKHKSVFLLGPRQVGKSTLIKAEFPEAQYFNLLAMEDYRDFVRYPESLRQKIKPNTKIIIIDEVQKLPHLLDEVQLLIDDRPDIRFILTGSSARKLKRGAANLLGGRALMFQLFPLCFAEAGADLLSKMMVRGGLPSILNSEIYWEELKTYVGTYLREEIQAEGLSRKIEQFSRFIDFAAYLNAEQLNYTKVGNDAGISPRTVRDYVQILIDTLLVDVISPINTPKRKAVATEKLYFFDLGVSNFLLGKKHIEPQTPDFGKNLEHLVYLELKAYQEYMRRDEKICYWRTQNQIEVDFVVGKNIAIEVKGSGRIADSDLKSILMLNEELKLKRKIVVCSETKERTVHGIDIIPYQLFFEQLWDGQILV